MVCALLGTFVKQFPVMTLKLFLLLIFFYVLHGAAIYAIENHHVMCAMCSHVIKECACNDTTMYFGTKYKAGNDIISCC